MSGANPTAHPFQRPPRPPERPPAWPPRSADGAGGGAPGPWLMSAPGCAILLALLTLARLTAAAGAGLALDESYYRLWALDPALGYLDHPPIVAWWIAGGIALLGDTTLGIRAPMVAAILVASLAVWRIAWLMTLSEREAARATIWFNATLLVGAGGVLATPDTPSLTFWALALWALAELRRSGDGRWWLAVGTFAGLGLLSKYSGLFLGAGILLWLAIVPSLRRWLVSPWLFAGGLVALLLFAPNLWWNAEHEFATFAKQFGRAAADRFAPQFLLEFLAAQALLIGPLMVPFLILGSVRIAPLAPARAAHAWLIIATTLPFLAYLLVHALHDPVQGNWPAPLYAGFAIVAALAAADLRPDQRLLNGVRAAIAPVGIGLALLVFAHASSDRFFLSDRDPTKQMRGWPAFAGILNAHRIAAGAEWIGTVHYGTTGEVAFALGGAAPVVPLHDQQRYLNLPLLPAATLAGPGLVVVLERRRGSVDLAERFGEVEPLQPIVRSANGVAIARYLVFRVAAPLRPSALHGVPAAGGTVATPPSPAADPS